MVAVDFGDLQQWLEEELHPDLVPYLRENPLKGGAPLVHHPLVVEDFIHIPGHANRLYAQRRESVERCTPPKGLFYYERPYRLLKLVEWWQEGVVAGEELREVLGVAWADAEGGTSLDNPLMVDLLDLWAEVGYYSDSEVPKPTKDILVYRGAEEWEGLSWTTRVTTAAWFANRFRTAEPPVVWQAVAPPEAVLATINQRNEHEVVVDPWQLTTVEEEVWPKIA